MEERLAVVEASQSQNLDMLSRLENNVPLLLKTVAELSVTVDRLSHHVEGQSEDIGPSHVETVMPKSDIGPSHVETVMPKSGALVMPRFRDFADKRYLVYAQQVHPELIPKAKRSSYDKISSLPSTIIETILCFVPIRDAVRTSILSKKWRYKWTKIPKLVFNENDMFDDKSSDGNQEEQTSEEPPNQRKHLTGSSKFFYAINQVLLLHQGPIRNFTLAMDANETCVEIDQIISYLSRHDNTLKKFTLDLTCFYRFTNDDLHTYRLPLSFFSLHHLTDLYLRNCDLDYEPTFSGFGNLTTLYLKYVNISGETLLHLLSSCPLLKKFSLLTVGNEVFGVNEVTIAALFKCLPMVEHLSIPCSVIKRLAANGVPRELPTSLVHLKYLDLQYMTFFDKVHLSILYLLIRSSPNLEKIKLDSLPLVGYGKGDNSAMNSAIRELEDYSDISLEHLNELEIHDFSNLKPEMEFVKVILAKSPVLRKVGIVFHIFVFNDEQLKILKTLLHSPRASPTVDINVRDAFMNTI